MRIQFSWLITATLIIRLFFINIAAVHAQDAVEPFNPQYEETFEGMPICAPGIYLVPPVDCLPMGPSQALTEWARNGLTLPLKPLPASHPDASLIEIDQNYAKLNLLPGVQASFYPDIESAVQGWGALSTLPIGETLYVAYKNELIHEGNKYVQNERGVIRASPTEYSSFQGLLLNRPPENDFGWIVDLANPRREPSYKSSIVNEQLVAKTVVQVYDQVEAEGTTWYMIGLGKWMERRYIRVVSPRLSPPEGIGKWTMD